LPALAPQARPRIRLVKMGLLVVALGMLVQLVRVQFGPYAPIFQALGDPSGERTEKVAPARGLIFDRQGRLLATNATMYYLEVEVRQLTPNSNHQIATVLSKLLLLPFEDLYAQLTQNWDAIHQYRIRLTRVDENGQRLPITVDETVGGVLQGFMADPTSPDLSGLALTPAAQRVYPAGSLAGHVLGFVNQEGKGFFGVEGFYDEWLSGKPITITRAIIPPEARLQPDPPAGVNLVLTIDSAIQQMVEEQLKVAIERADAESGQIIVMDPHTGEILAMAAWPVLDPNHYQPWLAPAGDSKVEPVIAPAVASSYEPGSTFKVLTMAAALDDGVVKPDDVFVDTGEIEVGGHAIRNWDGTAWGPQTMIGCLEHSLNVCLAYVAADKLTAAPFYDYLTRFGVGQLTGIDMAGEVAGTLRLPRDAGWTESDLGTNAFGQGVSVTPVQLLASVGAIANGGVEVQPHVVREVVGPQGVYWPKVTVLGNPVSAQTAHTLTEMLATSLEGETRYVGLDGYRLAGKTGTAQIPTKLGYDPKLTIASFVGWGPVDDPRFVVMVKIDKPKLSPWGSVIAAPAFQEVVQRLVVMLHIPPDPVRQTLAGR
jgi:cell division protein FtsI/penicillin-binding protein 2